MSALIYWLAIQFYALAVRIAALFNKKAKLFVRGRKGLLRQMRYALIDERRPRVWMHCASLGEFEQGRPLLEKLRKDHPHYAFVITFFSPSGYEVRKDYTGADYIFYLPIDSNRNAKTFLSIVQPKLCIFVKYEYWYFLLRQIARREIPAILVSAIFRKEQVFFKWYGGLHRNMLRFFSHLFVQDNASEQLLSRIGIEDVTVSGDTRFDRVADAAGQVSPLPEIESFIGGGKVLVAGSSWPEDEAFLLSVFRQLPGDWKLIIVPHEVHDSHIDSIRQLFDGDALTYSSLEPTDKRVLIVDKIGLLLKIYQYADVAWIGGGFGKGIHNTLEAAVYGIPLGFGPTFQKFREANELIAAGAAFSTKDPAYLVNCIKEWDRDPAVYEQVCTAAKNYVLSNAGATQFITGYLSSKKLLSTS